MSYANIEEQQDETIKELTDLLFEACQILKSEGCLGGNVSLSEFYRVELESRRKELQAEYKKLTKELPLLREATANAHNRKARLEELLQLESEF